jgi:hypothetical protein
MNKNTKRKCIIITKAKNASRMHHDCKIGVKIHTKETEILITIKFPRQPPLVTAIYSNGTIYIQNGNVSFEYAPRWTHAQ